MSSFVHILISHRIQIFSVAGSLVLFLFILTLIKRRRLKEEYAILWLGTAVFFFVLSLFPPLLGFLARLAGIHYAPAGLLLMLILVITVILIHYSTVLTKLSRQNKQLSQELALLRHELLNKDKKQK